MSKFFSLFFSLFICSCPLYSISQIRVPEELGILKTPGLSQPNCKKIEYKPIPVFDAPSGIKIGVLILDNPQWAIEDLDSCKNRPKLQILLNGSNVGVDIKVIKLQHGHFYTPYFDKKIINNKEWAQIKAERSYYRYWIPLSEDVVSKSYAIDLVQGVDTLETICDGPGVGCKPVSFAMQRLIEKAGKDRENCYLNAYDVIKVSEYENKLYYTIVLAKELQAAYPGLPPLITTPVYGPSGKWSGFYYFEGCQATSD